MQHFGSVVQTHVKLIAYLWRHQSMYNFQDNQGVMEGTVQYGLYFRGTNGAPENLWFSLTFEKVGFSTKTNKTKSDQILWHFWLI